MKNNPGRLSLRKRLGLEIALKLETISGNCIRCVNFSGNVHYGVTWHVNIVEVIAGKCRNRRICPQRIFFGL